VIGALRQAGPAAVLVGPTKLFNRQRMNCHWTRNAIGGPSKTCSNPKDLFTRELRKRAPSLDAAETCRLVLPLEEILRAQNATGIFSSSGLISVTRAACPHRQMHHIQLLRRAADRVRGEDRPDPRLHQLLPASRSEIMEGEGTCRVMKAHNHAWRSS